MHEAANRAIAENLKHFAGQKGHPMFATLANYCYERMNIPDWIHNLSRVFVWLMDTIVGPNREGCTKNNDEKHRNWSKANGIFRKIWVDTPVYLDHHLAALLRETSNADISTASRRWCSRWWRICNKKIETGTSVDTLRRQVKEWRNLLQQGGGIPIAD